MFVNSTLNFEYDPLDKIHIIYVNFKVVQTCKSVLQENTNMITTPDTEIIFNKTCHRLKLVQITPRYMKIQFNILLLLPIKSRLAVLNTN